MSKEDMLLPYRITLKCTRADLDDIMEEFTKIGYDVEEVEFWDNEAERYYYVDTDEDDTECGNDEPAYDKNDLD